MTETSGAVPDDGALPPGCLDYEALTARNGWSSVQVARNHNNRARKRREAGDVRPGDMPPPDGYARKRPYWCEETIAAWDAVRRRTLRDEDLPDGHKRCTKCYEAKPTTEFYLTNARDKYGNKITRLRSRCKTCSGAVALEWLENNPERRREADRRYKAQARVKRRGRARRYGLTVEQLDAMEAAQEGRCLICREESDELVVDHCHTTGKVRGLLCSVCNLAIGYFQDDPRRLAGALAYLVNSHAA